jgi:hypothetical protein
MEKQIKSDRLRIEELEDNYKTLEKEFWILNTKVSVTQNSFCSMKQEFKDFLEKLLK